MFLKSKIGKVIGGSLIVAVPTATTLTFVYAIDNEEKRGNEIPPISSYGDRVFDMELNVSDSDYLTNILYPKNGHDLNRLVKLNRNMSLENARKLVKQDGNRPADAIFSSSVDVHSMSSQRELDKEFTRVNFELYDFISRDENKDKNLGIYVSSDPVQRKFEANIYEIKNSTNQAFNEVTERLNNSFDGFNNYAHGVSDNSLTNNDNFFPRVFWQPYTISGPRMTSNLVKLLALMPSPMTTSVPRYTNEFGGFVSIGNEALGSEPIDFSGVLNQSPAETNYSIDFKSSSYRRIDVPYDFYSAKTFVTAEGTADFEAGFWNVNTFSYDIDAEDAYVDVSQDFDAVVNPANVDVNTRSLELSNFGTTSTYGLPSTADIRKGFERFFIGEEVTDENGVSAFGKTYRKGEVIPPTFSSFMTDIPAIRAGLGMIKFFIPSLAPILSGAMRLGELLGDNCTFEQRKQIFNDAFIDEMMQVIVDSNQISAYDFWDLVINSFNENVRKLTWDNSGSNLDISNSSWYWTDINAISNSSPEPGGGSYQTYVLASGFDKINEMLENKILEVNPNADFNYKDSSSITSLLDHVKSIGLVSKDWTITSITSSPIVFVKELLSNFLKEDGISIFPEWYDVSEIVSVISGLIPTYGRAINTDSFVNYVKTLLSDSSTLRGALSSLGDLQAMETKIFDLIDGLYSGTISDNEVKAFVFELLNSNGVNDSLKTLLTPDLIKALIDGVAIVMNVDVPDNSDMLAEDLVAPISQIREESIASLAEMISSLTPVDKEEIQFVLFDLLRGAKDSGVASEHVKNLIESFISDPTILAAIPMVTMMTISESGALSILLSGLDDLDEIEDNVNNLFSLLTLVRTPVIANMIPSEFSSLISGLSFTNSEVKAVKNILLSIAAEGIASINIDDLKPIINKVLEITSSLNFSFGPDIDSALQDFANS